MQRGDRPLGGLLGGEGAEVVGVVVEDLPDQRQPRPRLAGQLDPVHPLGEAGAAVVARLVLGDQPQLADLGLERGRALDALRPSAARPTISPIRERVSEAVK